MGEKRLFITIRIAAVCNLLSPAFSRLSLTTKRLSMDPGFLHDDMALSARSGLSLLSKVANSSARRQAA
jgi:hypothetical protein